MSYYYDLTVGFNWWYLIVPMALFALLVAWLRVYHFEPGEIRVVKRKRYDFCLKVVAILAAVVLLIIILAESLDGITQVFLNSLSKGENPLYAYIIVAFFCLVLGVTLWILATAAVNIGAWIKLGYLSEMRYRARRKQLREQEKQEEEEEEEEEEPHGELLFFSKRRRL